VTWTASATGCTTPQFRFWIFTPGVGWSIAQDWSTSSTFSWDTTGRAAGDYLAEAWARAGTSGDPQAQSADVPYTLKSASSPCTGVNLSASPNSPQTVGTRVTWTASATGCATPQFRFWIFTSGVGWSIAQDWSTSSTFSWDTTGRAAGDYWFEAWVRAGSSGDPQAQSSDILYRLQ
jgi:hypothetical protein